MTSTSAKLTVRSIAELISAVPYLLGFHPDDSVVVVAFRGPKIVFVARVDLPPPLAAAPDLRAGAGHLASIVANQDAEAATVIGYGPEDRVRPAVEAVTAALDRAGVHVVDSLRVGDGRYWSYTCDNPGCCPAAGRPYDPATSQIAAAATFAGHVALPDRAALVRQVAPTGDRTSMRRATERAERRLRELLAGPETGDRSVQVAGESAVCEAMRRHRDGGRLTDDEVAWLSLLLVHLPVRDHAWERLGAEDWHVALWTDVLRRADTGLAAAPASLLAFAAWWVGQGALASVAVEQALKADPDYSMALLIDEVLRYGIPPSRLDGLDAMSAAGQLIRRSPA